jgi:hypothetical protein
MQAQRRTPRSAKTEAEIAHGHICEIDVEKGIGCIETMDGRIIRFYEDSVGDRPFGGLTTGMEVRFTEKSGRRGRQAGLVQVIE